MDIRNLLQGIALALLGLALSGCTSELNRAEVEAKLTSAHEKCVSKSLKSEIPEHKFLFEATYSQVAYFYDDENSDRFFVVCMSDAVFGRDITELVHTREDKLYWESIGGDAELMETSFRTDQMVEKWDNPIHFARAGTFYPSYWFFWAAPHED